MGITVTNKIAVSQSVALRVHAVYECLAFYWWIFYSSNCLLTITYLQRLYTLKKVLHALRAGFKPCLLIKNVLLQLITPNGSMSMLDMLTAGLGLSTQEGVS